MKVFNVRMHESIPKSNKPIQISCDDRGAWRLALILQESAPVVAFNVEGDLGDPHPNNFPKYKKDLFEDATEITILDVLMKMAERVEKEFGGCKFESFVGSPGDVSPPHCNCERCIAAGRAYRYETRDIKLTPQMHEYFNLILKREADTKSYRWGLEFTLFKKCRISIYKQGNITICSNKPAIRIGVYVFDHKEKAWRSAP